MQSLSSFVGINGSNTTVDSGRLLISLKPQAVRDAKIRFLARLKVKNQVQEHSAQVSFATPPAYLEYYLSLTALHLVDVIRPARHAARFRSATPNAQACSILRRFSCAFRPAF